MQKESPYLILDDILSLFKSDPITVLTFEDIIIEVAKMDGKDREFVFPAIKKLLKEKYLEKAKIELPDLIEGINKTVLYSLTFEGILLIKSGGYAAMMMRETADASRKDFYEGVVAVGTGIAALYVIFQIIQSVLQSWSYWTIISHHSF